MFVCPGACVCVCVRGGGGGGGGGEGVRARALRIVSTDKMFSLYKYFHYYYCTEGMQRPTSIPGSTLP